MVCPDQDYLSHWLPYPIEIQNAARKRTLPGSSTILAPAIAIPWKADTGERSSWPKTRSGKILRGTIKKIADGEKWTMPATIDDPAILDEIGSALKGHGVGG